MRFFACGCCGASRRGLLRGAALGAAALAARAAHAQPEPPVAAPRQRVINTHAHYFPRPFLDLMAREGGRFGAGVETTSEGFVISALGGRTAMLPLKFIDLDQRIDDMDAQGVTIQAMSLTAPMVYWADAELSERLARAWNDAAAEAHGRYPDRLLGLMQLPMLDTDRALKELDRARALRGMRGVYLGTNINGTDLSDPRFTPIFEAIERANLPVFLHPFNTVGGERLRPFYLSNLLGNPIDTAIAAAHLIFGGVLDRFPRLEVNLPHAGGILPILTGRLDRGRDVRPELRGLPRAPSDYLRRFTYDTIAHSPAIMRFVIRQVGIDRITLGDDYCYDMGYDRPVDFVEQLQLSRYERNMVLSENAAKLLHL